MKKITFLLIGLMVCFSAQQLRAQTVFDWESATKINGVAYQEVNGITATVTSTTNKVSDANFGGYAGTSGKVVYAFNPESSITVSFNQAINITSVYVFDAAGSGNATWTFTPNGGNNPPVNQQIGSNGVSVALNWTNVTSFVITSSNGPEYFGLDDITFNTCTAPDDPSVISSPATVCSGGTASLNILGALNDATAWHVYTGSCGGTEIGTTTTNTFTIPGTISSTTTYYVRGEGGCVTPGQCGTVTITPQALDDASFNYSAPSYAATDSDPTPTITGLGEGTFSSTAGLSINASTGTIDVSASIPGVYTVTYTTAGACPSSSNKSVTVTGNYTWTGATDNNWNTAANWNYNAVPPTTANVIVPSGLTNYPTISSPVTVNSITINTGASLIATASVTASVTYSRNIADTNWYLVSTPVSGETQQDIIANNNFASGTESNLGIGYFTNNGATPWFYATSSSTGSTTPGYGFSVKLATPGDITTTGSLITTNYPLPITTGTRNNYNLIGNPFTSFINSATLAGSNSVIGNATFWLWDGTQYVTHNNANPIEIAPSQGFFVEASSNSNVTFFTSNLSHQGTDTFLKQATKPSLELLMSNNKIKSATNVYYIDGKTTGFDAGYDSKMFNGVTTNFAVFTELLTDNIGEKLAIQTLPNNDFEEMVIPVGVIAEKNQEIAFSVNVSNFPEALKVFIEDRDSNTFTYLKDANSSYSVTLDKALNGAGRFFIHTTNNTLSIEENLNTENISIYKSNKSTLRISGLPNEKTTVSLFNIIGKNILTTSFTSNGNKDIILPNLASGVYLVKLKTKAGRLNKKIILE